MHWPALFFAQLLKSGRGGLAYCIIVKHGWQPLGMTCMVSGKKTGNVTVCVDVCVVIGFGEPEQATDPFLNTLDRDCCCRCRRVQHLEIPGGQ